MKSKSELFSKVINKWLNTFAPAYRNVLPADMKPKGDLYLKFGGYYDTFASQFVFPVQIYKLKATSNLDVVRMSDKIANAVTDGGLLLKDEGIRVKIEKGSPYYQDKPDEDATIRAGYINLIITIY